jgi:hypothetical protein
MTSPANIYQTLPGLVLGFHGCDSEVGEELLASQNAHLRESKNAWDWLGNGIYFWENDPKRAFEFAELKKKHPAGGSPIQTPFVVGAVIDLKLCCNLLDRTALVEVKESFDALLTVSSVAGSKLPMNTGVYRNLDCAVFDHLHYLREKTGLPSYDTVRGLFWEGKELYTGSGMLARNHVQIAVRSAGCIKGYFRPFSY